MIRELLVTLIHGFEPGLGSKDGEPRSPDVCRDEEAPRARVQRNFKEVPGVQAEDWPPVGSQVPDLSQCRGDRGRRLERGRIEKVVHLPGRVVTLVDSGDLGREQKPDLALASWWGGALKPCLEFGAQAKQSRLGGNQRLGELGSPGGMGEVAGADHRDAFA